MQCRQCRDEARLLVGLRLGKELLELIDDEKQSGCRWAGGESFDHGLPGLLLRQYVAVECDSEFLKEIPRWRASGSQRGDDPTAGLGPFEVSEHAGFEQ